MCSVGEGGLSLGRARLIARWPPALRLIPQSYLELISPGCIFREEEECYLLTLGVLDGRKNIDFVLLERGDGSEFKS